MTKRKYTGAAVAVVLVLLAIGVGIGSTAGSPANVGAFTLKKNVTYFKPDGTQVSGREIYRRASDGSFRLVETDGQKIYRDFGFQQGRGFFTVDYGSRTLWRDPDQKPNRDPLPADARRYTEDSRLVGTDEILGRTAYHLRLTYPDGRVEADEWYLPETGGVPVKQIAYRGNGAVEIVQEPYSLEFGEPPSEFVRLPDFAEAVKARPQAQR